jgi:uncharacterized low-complexity protein
MLTFKEFLMNKKMLIALGASVCLSTAAFAADTTSSASDNTNGTSMAAPAKSDAMSKPSKPETNKADKAKSSDKTAEGKCGAGKCGAGKCAAGNCSGAPKK